jgi:amino acid transporter
VPPPPTQQTTPSRNKPHRLLFRRFARESPSSSSDSSAAGSALAVQGAVLGFTQALTTMRCTVRLPTMGSADAMVHLIAEARRLQRNTQQALLFALAFHLVLGCAYLLGLLLAAPVDVVPFGMVMWFSLAVVPAVVVAMHWTEAEAAEMTKRRMPRKRPGE